MSRAELLRRLVQQRLTQAADEICDLFIRTLEEAEQARRESEAAPPTDLQLVSKETPVPPIQWTITSDHESQDLPQPEKNLEVCPSQNMHTNININFSNVQVKVEKEDQPCDVQDHLVLVNGGEPQRWGTPAGPPELPEGEQMEQQGPEQVSQQDSWPALKQEQQGWELSVKSEPLEPQFNSALQDDSTSSKMGEQPAWWQSAHHKQNSDEEEGDDGDVSLPTSNSSDCKTEDSDDDDWHKSKTAKKKNRGASNQEPAGPGSTAEPEPPAVLTTEDKTDDSSDQVTEDSDEEFLPVKRSGSMNKKSKQSPECSSEHEPEKKKSKMRTLKADYGPITCPRCKKTLMYKSSLARHLENCCKKSGSSRKRGADKMMDPSESQGVIFQCSLCSKSFQSSVFLELHLRMHAGTLKLNAPGSSTASGGSGGDK
ncbi:zinc finger E-box-binding homeobox 1-like [Cololabis saira]|uniref:zinc finger E-box-binding homeobox 1-like n=1 Tax=Cololabis saira TaxID=129043 RepID=UPI002AD2C34B|nr:zinc finger E-box-binding homeobox 1-like [Cololabis saira]